jgi:ADP-ribosylglycohydrolase
LSLRALSVGDAFGELFFSRVPPTSVPLRRLPPGPWRWTDDTHEALSMVETLSQCGAIDPDVLAGHLARRFVEQPWRGYAGGAMDLLSRIAEGADWRTEAPALFEGGSWGNGGAMRVAPVGAYYAGDPDMAAEQADRSAAVTHAHPEGRAGAVAVAVAAAVRSADPTIEPNALLDAVETRLPAGRTRQGLSTAKGIAGHALTDAVGRLGTGWQVSAFDTAPFCVWMAAHHGTDFESCLWKTVSGEGDRDTTCAIVAGILGGADPTIPVEWLAAVEPLPEPFRRQLDRGPGPRAPG